MRKSTMISFIIPILFITELRTLLGLIIMSLSIGYGVGVWYFRTAMKEDENYNVKDDFYAYKILLCMMAIIGIYLIIEIFIIGK